MSLISSASVYMGIGLPISDASSARARHATNINTIEATNFISFILCTLRYDSQCDAQVNHCPAKKLASINVLSATNVNSLVKIAALGQIVATKMNIDKKNSIKKPTKNVGYLQKEMVNRY
jgi:hypothetical protein